MFFSPFCTWDASPRYLIIQLLITYQSSVIKKEKIKSKQSTRHVTNNLSVRLCYFPHLLDTQSLRPPSPKKRVDFLFSV